MDDGMGITSTLPQVFVVESSNYPKHFWSLPNSYGGLDIKRGKNHMLLFSCIQCKSGIKFSLLDDPHSSVCPSDDGSCLLLSAYESPASFTLAEETHMGDIVVARLYTTVKLSNGKIFINSRNESNSIIICVLFDSSTT